MEELQDLILFENENIRLDFKREEYRKESYPSFLKDVIAMANASTKEDRYIIVGLKPKSTEDRGFFGVGEEIIDSATYQQLINENIEPELSVDYFPYHLNGFNFGVFKISACNNPPYLMKKDYCIDRNRLFRGEGFIRRGSHQTRLVRTDYDKFTQDKIDNRYFNEEVRFKITTSNTDNEFQLINFEKKELPSQKRKKRIEGVLASKENEQAKLTKQGLGNIDITSLLNSMTYMNATINGGGIPYEARDISTLEKNLEDVETTYAIHDHYFLCEENSNKCNIEIRNIGSKYIEDATIIVRIPKTEGLFVLNKIPQKPNSNSINEGIDHSFLNYPEVTETKDYYVIENEIGNLKHQLPQEAFSIPLRIVVNGDFPTEFLKIKCELFAKNIKIAIQKELNIRII